jgi:clan AA aspartic protease
MGLASARILLANPRLDSINPVEVEALADSSATFLCIPEHVANQLHLETDSDKEVTTADGKRRMCRYLGPVHIRFENRSCYVGAIVLDDQVLLGAIPMEDMDLVVLPLERRIAVNPLNPNCAAGLAK